jgi:hypothetical protein
MFNLFDKEDEADTVLGPSGCFRCGEPEGDHCSDCGACYDHAGWCPQEGG